MSSTMTEFRMRMDVVGINGMITGKWEQYPTLRELHRASRSITGGRQRGQRFVDHCRSTNEHYARTGHVRYVFRKEDRNVRSPRTHVIIHVIAR